MSELLWWQVTSLIFSDKSSLVKNFPILLTNSCLKTLFHSFANILTHKIPSFLVEEHCRVNIWISCLIITKIKKIASIISLSVTSLILASSVRIFFVNKFSASTIFSTVSSSLRNCWTYKLSSYIIPLKTLPIFFTNNINSISAHILADVITETVKIRLSGLTVLNSTNVQKVAKDWGIKFKFK